ncbi:hypothetical protein C8Q79DRAFT_112302 [Trametes meyenii]|nr:hypothetical protein C8Q79DRAFT_112302 [Trametes meyenii]
MEAAILTAPRGPGARAVEQTPICVPHEFQRRLLRHARRSLMAAPQTILTSPAITHSPPGRGDSPPRGRPGPDAKCLSTRIGRVVPAGYRSPTTRCFAPARIRTQYWTASRSAEALVPPPSDQRLQARPWSMCPTMKSMATAGRPTAQNESAFCTRVGRSSCTRKRALSRTSTVCFVRVLRMQSWVWTPRSPFLPRNSAVLPPLCARDRRSRRRPPGTHLRQNSPHPRPRPRPASETRIHTHVRGRLHMNGFRRVGSTVDAPRGKGTPSGPA